MVGCGKRSRLFFLFWLSILVKVHKHVYNDKLLRDQITDAMPKILHLIQIPKPYRKPTLQLYDTEYDHHTDDACYDFVNQDFAFILLRGIDNSSRRPNERHSNDF